MAVRETAKGTWTTQLVWIDTTVNVITIELKIGQPLLKRQGSPQIKGPRLYRLSGPAHDFVEYARDQIRLKAPTATFPEDMRTFQTLQNGLTHVFQMPMVKLCKPDTPLANLENLRKSLEKPTVKGAIMFGGEETMLRLVDGGMNLKFQVWSDAGVIGEVTTKPGYLKWSDSVAEVKKKMLSNWLTISNNSDILENLVNATKKWEAKKQAAKSNSTEPLPYDLFWIDTEGVPTTFKDALNLALGILDIYETTNTTPTLGLFFNPNAALRAGLDFNSFTLTDLPEPIPEPFPLPEIPDLVPGAGLFDQGPETPMWDQEMDPFDLDIVGLTERVHILSI